MRAARRARRRATSCRPACRRAADRQSSTRLIACRRGRIAGVGRKLVVDLREQLLDAAPRARRSRRCGTRSRARRAAAARGRRAPRRCAATLVEPSKSRLARESVPSTLTNTLAWRRSRVTSTPVTVTRPTMRGSFTSFGEERRDLLADRLGDAVGAMMVRRHGSPERRCGGPGALACPAPAVPRSALRSRFERPRDFLGAIALDDVADLDVVEVLDADTALEPFAHFAHVVLEAAQRRDRAVVHLDAVADDADACPDD